MIFKPNYRSAMCLDIEGEYRKRKISKLLIKMIESAYGRSNKVKMK